MIRSKQLLRPNVDFIPSYSSLFDTRNALFNFTFGRNDISAEELPYLVTSYLNWVKRPTSLTFFDKSSNSIVLRRAAKRGNDVYRRIVSERLDNMLAQLEESGIDELFVRMDGRTLVSNVLYITLTWDSSRYPNRFNSWRFGLMKQYNNFITRFRQIYGRCWVFRVVESTLNGYPHIHIILMCENPFTAFRHGGRYRILAKHDIEDLWSHFVDVEAVSSLRTLDNYLRKDLDKQLRLKSDQSVLSSAMNWLFRKRSFAISSDFDLIRACVTQREPVADQVLEAKKEGLVFLGVVNIGTKDGTDPPHEIRIEATDEVLRDLFTYMSCPSPFFDRLVWERCELVRGYLI